MHLIPQNQQALLITFFVLHRGALRTSAANHSPHRLTNFRGMRNALARNSGIQIKGGDFLKRGEGPLVDRGGADWELESGFGVHEVVVVQVGA